jgi:hypothetical protein
MGRIHRPAACTVLSLIALAAWTGPSAVAGSSATPRLRAAARAPADVPLRGTLRSEGAGHRVTRTRAGSLEARPLLGPTGRPVSPPARPGLTSTPRVESGAAQPDGRVPGTPVSVGSGFDGLPNADPALAPSDSTGALGDSWYLTAVNVSTTVYDPSGTPQFAPRRLRSLGGVLPTGAFEFDPKVVYDQYDDHFVLAFLANERPRRFRKSWIVIATVADVDANDPNSWCITRIAGDQYRADGRQWADYPGLGYDADRITLTTNQFEFGHGYAGAQVVSLPKADLYDCDAGLSGGVFGGAQTRNPDGSRSFTIQPAQTVGGAAPVVQYLVEFEYRKRSGDKLVVFSIRSTPSGLALATVQKRVDTARVAFLGTQKGSRSTDALWDAGDLRLINAEYDADLDRIFTSHTIRKNIAPSAYPESAARWYEIRPGATLRASDVTREGVIGTSLRDYGWPVVATDIAGDVFITYSRAGVKGGGEYLSAWVAEVTPSSGVSETLLRAGEATYDSAPGPERWGDFNGIGRDPSDGSRVAAVNQYAADDGGSAGVTARWRQWVNLVTHA